MFYFLYGTNKDKAREKARELISVLQKKKPNASFFKVESDDFSEARFEELLGGQGLFENKYIVFVDSVFEIKEVKEFVLKKLKETKESENVFIFLEGKMDKTSLSKIEKKAEKVQSFDSIEEGKKKEEFNIFSLTDALGKRDKKNLWVLFQKTIMNNIAPEETHGVLFWQIKSMIVAKECDNPSKSGMAPYTYTKSKGYGKNWSDEELKKASSDLISIYHDSHRGIKDFNISLEKFILSI